MEASKQFKRDFLKATLEGDVSELKRLVVESGFGKELERIDYGGGQNVVHMAAVRGKTQVCEFLVNDLGFNIDSQDCGGNTPLIYAVDRRHRTTSVFLIEKGADIGIQNIAGFAALHSAAEEGMIDIMCMLLSRGVSDSDLNTPKVFTPLQCACQKGQKEAVKLLLDHGADPNATPELYESALMLTIMHESPECMELLLEAGADPNLISCGRTALIYAAKKGNTEIIKRLLKAGANPDIVDISKLMTPLEYAGICQQVDAVKTLFPVTSRIKSISDWSVDGLLSMDRAYNKEAIIQLFYRNLDYFENAKAKARDAFERKDYIDAIGWYHQAKQMVPQRADVMSNLSLCWAKLNQREAALDCADACVGMNPEWPKGHYRLGEALMLLHEYSEAKEAFAEALKLDPKNKVIEMAHREAVEAENAARECHLSVAVDLVWGCKTIRAAVSL